MKEGKGKRKRKSRSNHKENQLGMNPSTASNRLVKQLLFSFGERLDMQWCFQCGAKIDGIDDMSIEHKIPWLHSEDPIGLYYDLDNIAFSHKICNYAASRARSSKHPCPSPAAYRRGCRCEECIISNSLYRKSLKSRSY